jgi:hypothetical protein
MPLLPRLPSILRPSVACAAKGKYGKDANSAINRGAGAGEEDYLRFSQLLGLDETAARQALRSAPVQTELASETADFMSQAVGKVERYAAPTYSEFEAALKGSGYGIKRMTHNLAVSASSMGFARPPGTWSAQQKAPPEPVAHTGAPQNAPRAQLPAQPRVAAPEADAAPVPTREDFARLLRSSGGKAEAKEGDFPRRRGRRNAAPPSDGVIRMKFSSTRNGAATQEPPTASGEGRRPTAGESRQAAGLPKLKPAERRAQQERREAAMMMQSPVLPDRPPPR